MKAEIYNFKVWLEITDPVELEQLLEKWMEEADFNILNKMSHHFQPYGFTAIWLLQESHLAVHTFPEEGKSYVELSSCNRAKNEKFINLITTFVTQYLSP
ncbi:MAG: S-adenosylmethionine decarboxylase [Bacteroidota bacterium]